MAHGNFARRRGTGLRRDWRGSANERATGRQGGPSAPPHTVALIAAGLIMVSASAVLIPGVKLPSLPEKERISLSRTLYPRLSSVPIPPSTTSALPRETPVAPSPAEPVTIRELKPAVPVGETGATSGNVNGERKTVTPGSPSATSGSREGEGAAPRKPRVVKRSSTGRSRSVQLKHSPRTGKVRLAQANRVRRTSDRGREITRKRRSVRRSAPVAVAKNETRSSTREARSVRSSTTTAGWVGSTDSREEAFLREWRKFKTREERLQDEQRKRLSDQLIADPLE